MKVLIVDDNENNRYLLDMLLRGHGYDVVLATNGSEALKVLDAGGIGMIVSDILMPVMDGFELCRKVKSSAQHCHIPFIIYTATYTGPQDEAFAMKIGANRFVLKPCEPSVFMEMVRELEASSKRGTTPPPTAPINEEEVLKLYNERLVRKLEQKMMQLEQEVQARREAEQKAQAASERWQITFDAMLDPVALLDVGGAIMQCNRAFVDFLGQDFKTHQGQASAAPVQRIQDHIPDCPLEGALQSGSRETLEIQSGGKIFVAVVDPVKGPDGQIGGFVLIMRDVTERRRMEQQQKNLESQLQQAQKMEAVGRLASGVAHDFNNLLSVILGYGEIARESLDKDHALHEPLEQVYQAGLRARDLTRQLLAFSRKQILEKKALDLNDVVDGFRKLLRRLLAEDIQLNFMLCSQPLPILADAVQLEQVLMNLAVNAGDAMPGGGTLRIETAAAELNRESGQMRGVPAGLYALLRVSDTGCGMESSILDRIFEPFFTTKGAEKGTGLGLATTFGIIKQHGGNILAASEVGKGTTFEIYLPLRSKKIESEARPAQLRTPMPASATVLIIEDDPSVQKLASRILAKQGYIVIESDNVADAIEKSQKYKEAIHLVLTDMVMPGMNGPEAFAKIREQHPEAKALFMSGYADDIVARQGAMKAGVVFIQKPFSVQGLLEKCRQALVGE